MMLWRTSEHLKMFNDFFLPYIIFGSHCFNSPSPPRSHLPSHHSTLFSFFREKNEKNMKKTTNSKKKKRKNRLKNKDF